jgi:hypothetical protein
MEYSIQIPSDRHNFLLYPTRIHGPPTHSTQGNSTDCPSQGGFAITAVRYLAVSGYGSDPDYASGREHAAQIRHEDRRQAY